MWSALVMMFSYDLPSIADPAGYFASWNIGSLIFLVAMSVVSSLLTVRSLRQDLSRAQHYARQVLAFDRDFGGFLPPVERERVEAVLRRGGGGTPRLPPDES